jgi:thiol-disulfide isomerase/thioredoxin
MKTGTWTAAALVSLVGVAGTIAPAHADPNDGIKLEGTSARRGELQTLQFTAFDAKLLDGLKDWSGTPVAGKDLDGKVTVLLFWAGWHKPSRSAVTEAQRLSASLADKGLVVIGVHNDRGFEHAATMAGEAGAKFSYAHDAGNTLRAALKVDNDPDFVIVDRAGHLRFIDVETSSVRTAAERLLGETREEAVAVPTDLAAGKQQAERERWKTRDAAAVDGKSVPKVEFTPAPAEAFAKANWPRIMLHDTGIQQLDDLAKKVFNDKPKFALPADGMLPAVPDNKGKLTVVYYMDTRQQSQLNVVPLMNRTQDAFLRDVVVVGSTMRFDRGQGFSGGDDDQKKREERDRRYAETIASRGDFNHSITTKEIARETLGDVLTIGRSREELNLAVIASSDGIIRWVGNPFMEHFRPAIEALIKVDPGVQARRAAEDEAIRSGKK